MGAARILVIVVAFAAAIGLAFIVHGMTAKKAAPAPVVVAAAQPMAQVLVAKRDLPIGKRLDKDDLAWQSWPAANLNVAYITDGAAPVAPPSGPVGKAAVVVHQVTAGPGAMENLYGAIVREPLLTGEPVVARKIVRGGQGGYMSVVLQPGMRAIGVGVTSETGAGGFILPGDRVDLMQSRLIESSGDVKTAPQRVTHTILSNVRVLAIDQKTAPEKDAQTVVGAVATLEVPAEAAASVVDAKAHDNNLYLVLRSYADMGGTATAGATTAAPMRTQSIRVFRNGAISEVAVVQ